MNTHNAVVSFGKYQGTLLTRVPVGYLKWAVTNRCTGQVDLAEGRPVQMFEAARFEMERRRERLEGIEISSHAVDRFSLRHLDKWRLTHGKEEGIYEWMQRKGLEAWSRRALPGAEASDHGVYRIEHDGMVWVLEDLEIPVVKTVL